ISANPIVIAKVLKILKKHVRRCTTTLLLSGTRPLMSIKIYDNKTLVSDIDDITLKGKNVFFSLWVVFYGDTSRKSGKVPDQTEIEKGAKLVVKANGLKGYTK
ncbi:hypothetical protein DRO66_01840, partial [Candidatus Bathyarchaeota archaeon]